MSNRNIKLLVLCKDFDAPGGVSNFVRSILKNLPSNVSATQLSIGRPTGREGLLAALLAPFLDNVRLVRNVRALRPDCVHLNPSLNWTSLLRDGVFLVVLRLMGVRNVLVFFHGWREADAARIQRSSVLRWLFVKTFGAAPVICVLASRFKDALVSIGVPEASVQVTTTMFESGNFADVRRARSDEGRVFTFLGRLVREKGVFETLDAFGRLAHDDKSLRLIVAGDGPALAELKSRAQALGVAEQVAFPGYVTGSDKAQLLLDSDVYVFPTYYPEGCPVSLLEAMAAGLPAIAGDAGGIRDIIATGSHGVILDQVTVDLVAREMQSLLDDPQQCVRIGERNREYAWREFAPSAVVGKILQYYAAAMGQDRFSVAG
jgi:glycosyltransferase involved in cell wall biosynthesis